MGVDHFASRALPPAFRCPACTQQFGYAPPVNSTNRNHTIEYDDATAAPACGGADYGLAQGDLLEHQFRAATERFVKFWRIEIGDANFNPAIRIGIRADA